jgi:hypothetical protein
METDVCRQLLLLLFRFLRKHESKLCYATPPGRTNPPPSTTEPSTPSSTQLRGQPNLAAQLYAAYRLSIAVARDSQGHAAVHHALRRDACYYPTVLVRKPTGDQIHCTVRTLFVCYLVVGDAMLDRHENLNDEVSELERRSPELGMDAWYLPPQQNQQKSMDPEIPKPSPTTQHRRNLLGGLERPRQRKGSQGSPKPVGEQCGIQHRVWGWCGGGGGCGRRRRWW